MDWSNERYVRVYTRDTTAMRLMSWDELCPFWELLRKVDRAGVLDLEGHGIKGLAAHLRTPLDVTSRAVSAWVSAGWVELHGPGYCPDCGRVTYAATLCPRCYRGRGRMPK